jgi:RimJ/RimL family protein N-acetyltransferase
LSGFSENDLLDPFDYLSDPEAVRFEPNRPMMLVEVREELEQRIALDEMVEVELKSSGKLIGNVYLGKTDNNALEIGFVFNKRYWNQGYARENCEASIQDAFSSGIAKIYAECDPDNQSSWKLLERLGFTREAHLIKNTWFWRDEQGEPILKVTYFYSLENS